jgi:hypothetical protein
MASLVRVRLNRSAATAKAAANANMEILGPVQKGCAFLASPQLLQTENREEFDDLHKALQREIKPQGIIEEMYVADICCISWEILRLRRCTADHQFRLRRCVKGYSQGATRENRSGRDDV